MRSFRRATVAVVLLLAAVGACADDAPDAPGRGLRRGRRRGSRGQRHVHPGDTIEFQASRSSRSPRTDRGRTWHLHGRSRQRRHDRARHHVRERDRSSSPPGVGRSSSSPCPGRHRLLCSIPGHADAGMIGRISRPPPSASGPAEGAAADDASHGGSAPAAVEPDPDAPPTSCATLVLPGGARARASPVRAVRAGGGDLIEVELLVEEKLMTVAEGYQQLVWTFDGTVPGPCCAHRSATRFASTSSTRPRPRCRTRSTTTPHRWRGTTRCARSPRARTSSTSSPPTTPACGCTTAAPTRPAPHRQRDVRDGHRRARRRAAADRARVLPRPERVVPRRAGRDCVAGEGQPGRAGARLRDVQRRRPPVRRQPDRGRPPARTCGCSCSTSVRRSTRRSTSSARSSTTSSRRGCASWPATTATGAPRPSICRRPRARSSSCVTAEDGLYPIVTHAFNFPGRGALGLLQAGDGQP